MRHLPTRLLATVAPSLILIAAACGGSDTDTTTAPIVHHAAGSSAGGASASGSGGSAPNGGSTSAGSKSGGASGATTAGAAGASTQGGAAGASSAGAAGGDDTGDDGSAGAGACDTTHLDCNDDPTDGCETDTTTDPTNCGSCTHTCAAGSHALATCVNATCGVTCAGGYADCDLDASNGCEAHPGDDVLHCGSCTGPACGSGKNGTAACTTGKCTLDCAAGFGNCDADSSNGCEADLSADTECGACGTACQSGSSCVAGTGTTPSTCSCATTSANATLVPLDLYIILDHSDSMSQKTAGGTTKFAAISAALDTFLEDPANTGIGVGIQYFPVGASKCNATNYSTPDLEIADLPGATMGLEASIKKAAKLVGGTPTYGALDGATQHAEAWKMAHPDHVVVVVLATDGLPSGCDTKTADIAAFASAAFASPQKIVTFAIGVFASGDTATKEGTAFVSAIATAGGSTNPFIVDTSQDVASEFSAAMTQIRKTSVGCEYLLPAPGGGQTLDPSKVNVDYTSAGGKATALTGVATSAACDASGGWYYDDPTKPAHVELCPATCTAVQADPSAAISVLFGCATIKPLAGRDATVRAGRPSPTGRAAL